ncbi:MAG: hypothetical protein RSE01_06830 [Akkermansia sp.]
MMKNILVFLFCSILTVTGLAQNASAQTPKVKAVSDNEVQSEFWTGTFATGQIIVSIHKIASVSQQRYLLDGQVLVYEVCIDVSGNALTRIYYIEPLTETSNVSAVKTVTSRAKEVFGSAQNRVSSADLDIDTTVTKNYPLTTHSHTIEYRLASLAELNAVYKSLSTAIQRGKGRTYTYAK